MRIYNIAKEPFILLMKIMVEVVWYINRYKPRAAACSLWFHCCSVFRKCFSQDKYLALVTNLWELSLRSSLCGSSAFAPSCSEWPTVLQRQTKPKENKQQKAPNVCSSETKAKIIPTAASWRLSICTTTIVTLLISFKHYLLCSCLQFVALYTFTVSVRNLKVILTF